jgi:hypothetical protein
MSSPPPSPLSLPAGTSCPFQLSEEAIASFAPELPPLDESRMSPALAARAAQLRMRFVSATADIQNLTHAMRKVWMHWHRLPVIPLGKLQFIHWFDA